MNPDLPLDQDARSIVVGDLHRNLFVEAGAGTGKTTTLVHRIVRLVATSTLADIRQLAAITFTEAAAAELRDRIRTALELAADPASLSDLDDEQRARCRAASLRTDDAVITTLHGFAQRILAEHPVAAHLPPAFEVDEGIPAELEFVHRWQQFVDRLVADPELADVLKVGSTLELLLPRLAEVARVLKDRWDRLVPLAGAARPVAAEPFDIDPAPILAAFDAIATLHAPHAGADDRLVALIERSWLPARLACHEAAGTGDPLELLLVLDTAELASPGNAGTAGYWGKEAKADMQAAIVHARDLATELLSGLRTRVLTRLAPELIRFTLDWADERRRAGRLHFHDLLVLARNLLWRDATVRAALAQRWSVLVIDEFQDTDPLQVELVFALAAADPTQLPARWEDIELGPGRVLVVGDPKQSIYGFRGADITLWNRTRALFDGGVVRLTQNFRSVAEILDWLNPVFTSLMGEGQGDIQPPYSSLSPHRTSLDSGRKVLFLGGESTERAAIVRLREAEEIALAIVTLRATGHEVADERPGASEDGCRPMRHDDIAILVPTRSPIGALERALDEHDIPYRIESRSLVWRTDAVRDVLNLLTAIEDPADDVAVVAALRSPAFACSDRQLLEWRNAGGRWDHTRSVPEEIPEGHAVLEAMATLRRWHHGRHWRPVDAVVDAVLTQRRMVELTMAQRRPRDHWRRLRFVHDQARAFVEAGGASLADFLEWAALQVGEGATAIETVVPEPDDDAVRILTVHGAKGLEFPVVVLAGLANGRAPTTTDVAWTASGPELMVSALGGGVHRRFATAGWAAAKDDATAFDRAESTRLLYVAATRARDTLIVSLHHPRRAASDSLIKQLYPVVAGTSEVWAPVPPPAPVPLFPAPRRTPRTVEQRAAWLAQHDVAMAAARRGFSVSPTGLPHTDADAVDGDAVDGDVVDTLDDDAAPAEPTPVTMPADSGETGGPTEVGARAVGARGGTAMGRAVHAVLERHPLHGAAPVDVAALATLAASAAAAEGVDEQLVTELATSALESAALAEARAVGRFWREVPIVVPIGDRMLEGFIDLLYERADGSVVVVDWKTDKGRSPAEVGASLARYRQQGAAYAAGIAAATGRTVAEVRFVFCRAGGEPAVERTITDLHDAVAEVELLLR